MIIAVELREYVTGTCILDVIIYKFRYWQEFCPMVLLPIDKNMQISFYCAMFSFLSAICLGIKCREKLSLDFQQETWQKPQL